MISLYIFTTAIIVVVLFSWFVAVRLFERATKLAPYYSEKETLEKEIGAANQELQHIRQEYENLTAQLIEARETIASAQVQQKWLDENKGKVESLKIQIAATQTQLEEVNKKYQAAVDSLQEKNTELQKVQSELQSSHWELQKTELQKEDQESKLIQLVADKKALETAVAEINADIKRLTDLAAQKKLECDGLETKLTAARTQLTECERRVKEEEAKRCTIQKEIKDLEGTRNNLRTEISQLEYELSGFVGKEQALAKKWEDLDREIKIINIANPKNYAQDEWLPKFEGALKESGFEFSSRLIKAFHTSLKVADYSPLVVLAGISGTGKSLLPELYAHAAGMNFLQIPVQPRWDSPQDMLGFYNYMEGRYKATELARLLWQTDCVNNKEKAPNPPGMNLILLDEMNLARVEYYFSDMLSKLEVRRGLNPKDKIQRRAAEIVLEGGASGGAECLRRIFVGSHNLFVGTMNEDESTQSLSDKVKDRANVLRFGRPKNLDKMPTSDVAKKKDKKAYFFDLYKDRFMSFEQWLEWQNPVNGNTVDLEMKKLAEINEQLALIGRPFAHRLWNTAEAYIRQYPGSARDALIDQLEMKIMPRLNGLDLTENSVSTVVDRLASWVDGLGDPILSKAFNQSKNDKEFFMWQGTDRDT